MKSRTGVSYKLSKRSVTQTEGIKGEQDQLMMILSLSDLVLGFPLVACFSYILCLT